eukprot:g83217.t1
MPAQAVERTAAQTQVLSRRFEMARNRTEFARATGRHPRRDGAGHVVFSACAAQAVPRHVATDRFQPGIMSFIPKRVARSFLIVGRQIYRVLGLQLTDGGL